MSESDRPATPPADNPHPTYPSYKPGHSMHVIHASRLGETPWGWREGVVRTSSDGVHVIDYVLEDGWIEVWSKFCPDLEPGLPVRVHEQYYALDIGGRWFNVLTRAGGLGGVPEPVDPVLWAEEFSVGWVDNCTGEGVGPTPKAEG